jgi:hypothetical protein
LTEVFDPKGRRELGIIQRKANFLKGFATGDFERGFGEGISFSAREGSLAC